MFNEEYEAWTDAGTDKKRVWHKRTRVLVATFYLNHAEGFALFNALRKLIRDNGGKLFDVDVGEYLK